jgi:hypothetical protein
MSQASRPPSPALSRRTLFAGASAAGALAAVAVVAPRIEQAAPEAVASAQPAPEADGRYQLTEHVNRYYQTARV